MLPSQSDVGRYGLFHDRGREIGTVSDFKQEIIHSPNRFFRTHHRQEFTCRFKQHKFGAQYADVLVNSPDPRYCPPIECKSISDKKTCFTWYFYSVRNKVHKADSITEFLAKTGRTGFPAIDFRFGAGKSKGPHPIIRGKVRRYYHENKALVLNTTEVGTSSPAHENGIHRRTSDFHRDGLTFLQRAAFISLFFSTTRGNRFAPANGSPSCVRQSHPKFFFPDFQFI
jgi:hypothetical protein